MARSVLIEEFHVGFYLPRGATIVAARAVRRHFNRPRIREDLRQLVAEWLSGTPLPTRLTVKVSR